MRYREVGSMFDPAADIPIDIKIKIDTKILPSFKYSMPPRAVRNSARTDGYIRER